MNISDGNINLNTSSSRGSQLNSSSHIRVSENPSNVEAKNVHNISGNSQITQIHAGQSFRGQIVNITNGGEVNIQLDNNSILRARMAEAMSLNIGDTMEFLVKENDGLNVLIKPFSNNTEIMKDATISRILDANNFMPTEKNYQIAESLMKNNLPLDKTSMQKVIQQSYKFPEAPIDTLISLNKLGIPISQETIKQYNAYQNNTHQLVQDLTDFTERLSNFAKDTITEMIQSSFDDNQNILNFSEKLFHSFSDELDFENILQKNAVGITGNEEISENSLSKALSNDGLLSNHTEHELQFIENQNMYSMEELSEQTADKFGLKQETINQFLSEMKNAGFSNEQIKELVNKSDTAMQFLNNMNALLKENPDLLSTTKILQSESFHEFFKETIKKKFSLNPSLMKEPKELDDLYKNIYEKTNKIMNSFQETNSQSGEQLKESAKGIQERLNFIQNLNEMYAYAQIPFRISGKDRNSELFVYMNKKNLREKKEDVSAMLHLDMEHLGSTDVHVSLHGQTVHTRFYVEDEKSAKIIDEHMNQLEQAINENGFTLTNEVVMREPSLKSSGNMVVDEMLGLDLEKSVKRYSFDIRT